MLTRSEVRAVVFEELRDVLEEDLDEIGELTGQEGLHELELNSLALARLIIRLEVTVGADPFADGELAVSDVRSVDELVAAYENAVVAELTVNT